MSKILTVSSDVQKVVFEKILLSQISSGFWKNARPADHADNWKGVEIVVGTELGATGFDIPRNYNFVNPDFFPLQEEAMLEVAKEVDPDITTKKLKKHLLTLNQILGARIKTAGGTIAKLSRGRKAPAAPKQDSPTKTSTVRRAMAQIVEEESV